MSRSIFGLMNEVYPILTSEFPWTKHLRWHVTDTRAAANVDQLADLWVEDKILKYAPPPDFLPVIDFLHKIGWKRGGWHDIIWNAYVYYQAGDLEVRLLGGIRDRPDGRDDTINSLFAPEQPPLPARGGGKKLIAAIKEYDRKCREDEW